MEIKVFNIIGKFNISLGYIQVDNNYYDKKTLEFYYKKWQEERVKIFVDENTIDHFIEYLNNRDSFNGFKRVQIEEMLTYEL